MKWLNPLNWLEGAVKVVAEPVAEWQRRKTQKQQQQFEIEKIQHEAALENAKRGEVQSFTLDQIAMKNMEKSWKDELILIVFLAPVVAVFLGFDDEVLAGFGVLEKMPDWYMWLLVGMVVVVYGMRGLFMKIAGKRFGL